MPKKEKIGQVLNTTMDKTVVVKVIEYNPHPKYKKIISETKKYKAHNEGVDCAVGDEVRIIENRPISRTKLWKVVEVTKRMQ
ncbi:MAG: 30S ribosomal protein S17 [Candidatus Melainabacteria bacterium GWF2_37_15]|nr:MAG: 30S ribosomal protein S17 [Candidatus Melainabacteria bacterium GWF2_37_15]